MGAQPAQPSLGKWSSWDPPAQNSRMESYRSQLGQARQPKQYQVPKTRAIRNWEFLFGEPSVGTHPLNCQAQPPALGPELSATSKKVILGQQRGQNPRATVQPFPGSDPSSLLPEDNCSIGWAGKRRLSSPHSLPCCGHAQLLPACTLSLMRPLSLQGSPNSWSQPQTLMPGVCPPQSCP